ncbi:alpha-L-glutamate ligase-like protein [Candidatus Collierbacteria bacterium CG10_big_fil_rev_8_21_14_0_10_43_36]|uniref:Alpha-L-glutamate ligase-like protein n=3 Tax=Candidatus Collieribacteriota TaxID=1752725 RepID=A0A2H0DU51_9BACT|nr:alpha-L-glutamate ligase-like protein [bacterium]PIP85249.1 MAG: alpha-L-glutamate ligase-like protein [Candidatus Collierbacteria bacterium CG22_combo_CG10-13_8_21_14_all_43_12]PIS00012.1 MAG: alpha-L-glutamate ligase-like protein [Candidatus Collierbacteria bacterium CG10_big_fil_rev_8_21_14_0_10_43_36]PIZ24787.1 MAG: alpha-L-glutamate ligase-like protein [Candidatus Collierbacteria bacterium CG_4_10_14_0_8_um_filter_43_86]PJB47218.1 MAG: alpha-L-glutamate ligase-like protein [Candidatus C
MPRLSDILGLNARSADYLLLNLKSARRRADDKLLTKKMLKKAGVAHPRLLGAIDNAKEARLFKWNKLKDGFAIKPVQGFGGQGIVLIKKMTKESGVFLTVDDKKAFAEDLVLHSMDIAEGKYSHNNLPDKVMIEERIKIHPKFKKLAVGGAPDVRVIVYNNIPVMAMLRLPTEESMGKANLHQGAIGLGIDIATGITTHGVYKNRSVKFFPDTNIKVNGITIPYWNKILRMAVETQLISKLNYLSVDMLIDEEKGPVVLELNDQPGLSIQIANMAGLRRRLERVEGLEVEEAEKGVKIGKALFASKFANRVRFLGEEKPVVGIFEKIKVRNGKKKMVELNAKIDTGARSSSIDYALALELGLLTPENVLWTKKVKNSLGIEERTLIALTVKLKGRMIKTRANVTDRNNLRRQLLIGRRDLRDFVVDPGLIKIRK